jgi:hypothetical protein
VSTPIAVACFVALIGVAALSIPFLARLPAGLPFGPADLARIAGARSARSLIGASVLLFIMGVGLYGAVEARGALEYWQRLLWYGSFLVLLLLTVLAPPGRIRELLIRVLELYLVVIGIAIVVVGVFHFWIAASEGRAIMPRRVIGRTSWVTVGDEPFWFWCSVISAGVVVWVITSALRGYFVRKASG